MREEGEKEEEEEEEKRRRRTRNMKISRDERVNSPNMKVERVLECG